MASLNQGIQLLLRLTQGAIRYTSLSNITKLGRMETVQSNQKTKCLLTETVSLAKNFIDRDPLFRICQYSVQYIVQYSVQYSVQFSVQYIHSIFYSSVYSTMYRTVYSTVYSTVCTTVYTTVYSTVYSVHCTLFKQVLISFNQFE